MQSSTVLPELLTGLLGLAPTAVSGDRPEPVRADGELPFAALLGALAVTWAGETLPAGGKVLPPGAASRSAAGAGGGGLPAGRPAAAVVGNVVSAPLSGGGPVLQPHVDLGARRVSGPLAPSIADRRVPDGGSPTGPAQPSPAAEGRSSPSTLSPSGKPSPGFPPAGGQPPVFPPPPSAPPSGQSLEASRPAPAPPAPPRPRAASPERAPGDVVLELAEHVDFRAGDGLERAADAVLRSTSGALAFAARGVDATAAPPAPSPAALAPSTPASVAIDGSADVPPSAAPRAHDPGPAFRGTPAELHESVAARIRVMIDEGTGEARLKLNPPELGAIDVRIAVVDDKTFVQLTAGHAAGRDALEQSLPRLRELLAAGGLDVGGASVDGGGRGAGSGGGSLRADAAYASHVDVSHDDALHDERAAPAGSAVRTRASGGIDLYA